MTDTTCSVEGCDRPLDCRGFCNPHYQRFRRNGHPGGAIIAPHQRGALCSVDGCENQHYAKGYCNKHWQRWHKYGDADAVFVGHWKADEVGYSGVHERLNRYRGYAREHPCAFCGQPAVDWSYDHQCPNELVGIRHGYELAYSTDLDHYMPLCRLCHSRLDENFPRRKVGAT